MYKIFRGFHLVETYQELKKAKRLAEKRIVSRGIKLADAIMLSLELCRYHCIRCSIVSPCRNIRSRGADNYRTKTYLYFCFRHTHVDI